jgi:hypothetical protein
LRVVALVCLLALVFSSLAAPSHRHYANGEVNCLICHAAPEASLSVLNSAVEPGLLCLLSETVSAGIRMPMPPPQSFRTPRAPPVV